MEPHTESPPQVPRSGGPGSRVIKAATAKHEGFAITINDDAIGVIEGALIWSAAHFLNVYRRGPKPWAASRAEPVNPKRRERHGG